MKIRLPDDRELVLNGVQLVPEMHARLMSVRQLADKGAKLVFEGNSCKVYRGNRLLFEINRSRGKSQGLPKAHLPVVYRAVAEAHPAAAISMDLAHQRLAHAAPSTIAMVIQ